MLNEQWANLCPEKREVEGEYQRTSLIHSIYLQLSSMCLCFFPIEITFFFDDLTGQHALKD